MRTLLCGLALALLAAAAPAQQGEAPASTFPEGRLCFERLQNQVPTLLVCRPDGSSPHFVKPVMIVKPAMRTPSWAPDGERLALAVSPGKLWKLFAGRLGEQGEWLSTPVQLTGGDGNHEQPCWSPDSSIIAYVSWDASGAWLKAVGADARAPVTLAEIIPVQGSVGLATPSWSADGRYIAYSSGLGIWLYDTAARKAAELCRPGILPAWSPDGKWLAFQAPGQGVVVVSPDGKERKLLVKRISGAGRCAWSPDGKRLIFRANNVGEARGTFWSVNADGSGLQPVNLGVGSGYIDWGRPPAPRKADK